MARSAPQFQPLEFNPYQRVERIPTVDKPVAAPVEGIVYVLAIDQRNELLILATDEGFAKIKAQIELLDKPLQQVKIEMQFIEVGEADARAFEIDFKPTASVGELQLGSIRKPFQATLVSLLNDQRARSLFMNWMWRPRPMAVSNLAINNIPTDMRISLKMSVPFFARDAKGKVQNFGALIGKTDADLSAELETRFLVTPTIKGDKTITVQLVQSRTIQFSISNANPKIPPQTLESLQASRNVHEEETFAFKVSNPQSFPLVAELERNQPIIWNGPLPPDPRLIKFKIGEPKQLLVFVTARIYQRPEDEPIPNAD